MSSNKPPFWFWVSAVSMLAAGVITLFQVDFLWAEMMSEPLWQLGYEMSILGVKRAGLAR